MKRLLLFLLLAGGGLAILATVGGGFFGEGVDRDKPEVRTGSPIDPAAPGIKISDFDRSPGARRAPAGTTFHHSKQFETFGQEWREWLDPVSGERFTFPVFVTWTFHAGQADAVQDPFTGNPGAVCKDVRVRLFREPQTRAEAEALKADPNARSLLVQWEITGEEGRADFVPTAAASDDAQAGPSARDGKGHTTPSTVTHIVHLTKAVRLTSVRQQMTLECTDLTLDLRAGTAVGRGQILADFPTYVIHGRGLNIERDRDRVEIEEDAVMDVKSVANAPGTLPPLDIGVGEFRPRRLSTPGAAIITRLVSKGESGLVALLPRRMHMDEDGGGTLDADSAEMTAVKTVDPASGAEQYKLRTFQADGHLDMSHPGGEGPDRFLAGLAAESVLYQVATSASGGSGLTKVTGPGWVTYRGSLATAGATTTPGSVRATFQKEMLFGPAGEAHPEAPLRLLLDGSTSVERTMDDGSTEPDRIESDRIDVFLRQASKGSTDHAAPPPGITGRAPSSASSLIAIGFSADGAVRLFGPHVSGTADRLHAEGLDQPGARWIAEGPNTLIRASSPKRGQTGSLAGARPAPANGRGGDEAPAKTEWSADSIRATGDVRVMLRTANAPSARPVIGEGEILQYRPEDGARLTGRSGRDATLAMVVGEGHTDRVAAPTLHYAADGSLTAEGKTHAEVWSGGRADGGTAPAAESEVSQPDVVELRSGSRIEVEETPLADSDYRLRIAGGGSIAFHRGSELSNRVALSAQSIEVAMAQRAPRPGDSLLSGSPAASRVASRRPAADTTRFPDTAPSNPKGKPPAAPVLWTLDCMHLSLAFDSAAASDASLGNLRSLVADGSVVAASDTNRIRGGRFEIDGVGHKGRLNGDAGRRALLALGQGERAQRIASADMEFWLTPDGGIEKARIAGPYIAVLRPSQAGGAASKPDDSTMDHVDLAGDGDLWVTDAGSTTDGHVIARGTARSGKQWSLSTPHLEVEAPGMLAGGAVALRKMTATGDATRIDMGVEAGGNPVAAIGDRLVYDAGTSIATITGKPQAILINQGKRAFWKTVWLNLKTQLPDFEGGRIVIGGAPGGVPGAGPAAGAGGRR